jgi:CheY-specific phosphatase CheX
VTTTTAESTLSCLDIDPVLLSAIVKGVVEGLAMTDIVPPPVGASRLVSTSRPIAVVVGMVGRCNGSLTLSFDERTMLFIAGALMGEPQKEVASPAASRRRSSAPTARCRTSRCPRS